MVRKHEFAGMPLALRRFDAHDVGDDLACLFDHHDVADAHVLGSISSALCRLARLTTVPASSTGCKSATGVIVPVLPT